LISVPPALTRQPASKSGASLSRHPAVRFQAETYRFKLEQPEIRLLGKQESFTAPSGYRMQISALCWNEADQCLQFRQYFYKEDEKSKSLEVKYDYLNTPPHGTVFANEFGEMVIIDQVEKKLRFRDGSWMDGKSGDLYNVQGSLLFSKNIPDTGKTL
jgi:hypothetical protein